MTAERKYNDEEIQEIFDIAFAEGDARRHAVHETEGLTISQLQEVALDVGLDPERVALAARALDTRHDEFSRRTSLGMPIRVGRVIELPRIVTDREWELLVGSFRGAFGGTGRIISHGNLREWQHGDVHAILEPTEEGHRLRLEAQKPNAMTWNRVGLTALLVGLILLTVIFTGTSPEIIEMSMMLLVVGGGITLATNKITLPRWGRDREAQMDALVGHVRALIADRSSAGGSDS